MFRSSYLVPQKPFLAWRNHLLHPFAIALPRWRATFAQQEQKLSLNLWKAGIFFFSNLWVYGCLKPFIHLLYVVIIYAPAYSSMFFWEVLVDEKQHSSVTPWPRLNTVTNVELNDGRASVQGWALNLWPYMAIEWGRWWWTGGFWMILGQPKSAFAKFLSFQRQGSAMCLWSWSCWRDCLRCWCVLYRKSLEVVWYKNGVYGDFTNKNCI